MLIQFTVGNYRSFKDPVTLSMVAANLKAKDETLDENNTFAATPKLRLLKSAALYGANASGKSNLVKALKFMRDFVINSARESQAGDRIPVEPFRLSTETENAPSFFEIVFLLEGVKYRYGFEVDAEKVHSEWLFYTPKTKEVELFSREDSEISYSAGFKEGKDIDERTRKNALFLSVVSQFNGKLSLKLRERFMFLDILSGLEDRDYSLTLLRLESKYELPGPKILPLIQKMDLAINDLIVEKHTSTNPDTIKLLKDLQPTKTFGTFVRQKTWADFARESSWEQIQDSLKKRVIKTSHTKFDAQKQAVAEVIFDLDGQESEGTKKLIASAGEFCTALWLGQTLIIDELDARLHPLITQSIIRLFNSPQNNKGGQLIFTTHDTNLLSNNFLRRDQIWFTEKDKYGATDLYSLAEYKVRNDASYEKNYIVGKYGAIPFIGSLDLRESGADD